MIGLWKMRFQCSKCSQSGCHRRLGFSCVCVLCVIESCGGSTKLKALLKLFLKIYCNIKHDALQCKHNKQIKSLIEPTQQTIKNSSLKIEYNKAETRFAFLRV